MNQALISLVTAAAVLMHTLLCCSAHGLCLEETCCTACESEHEPLLEFTSHSPWLEGDFAGFACCQPAAMAKCCHHHHAPKSPQPERCACVLAAPQGTSSSREITASHAAHAPLCGLVDSHSNTAAEPFYRLLVGNSPPRYGALRGHLALGVLLR